MTIRSTRREFLGATASVSALLFTARRVSARHMRNIPERNLTLIVPYGAGGGTDITARLLARDLEPMLGKPVTVENRAGGGGWIGWGALAAAKPDGYTLGYLNVPSMYAGYLDPQIGRKETARELHADHQPRDRLQCLGGEGRQPVQDREGRDRRGEEAARHHHRLGLRRRKRRPYRDPRDRGRDRHQVHRHPQQEHRRSQDPGARRPHPCARRECQRGRRGGEGGAVPPARRHGAGALALPAQRADLQGAGLQPGLVGDARDRDAGQADERSAGQAHRGARTGHQLEGASGSAPSSSASSRWSSRAKTIASSSRTTSRQRRN